MMEAELNLLSPNKKTKLRQLVKFVFIKELLELVILTCAIIGISYIIGWLVLTSFFSGLAQSTTIINRDFSQQNQEIVQINGAIRALRIASADFAPISPALLELVQATPGDIRVTNLEINRANGKLSLSGVAKTREGLLAYQKILNGLPAFKDVTIPTSQLFQKDDTGFQITAKIVGLPTIKKAAAPGAKQPAKIQIQE